MVQQLSVSLSDLVLSLSSFHAAFSLLNTSYSAFLGFCIIAIAASLGTTKFALGSPPKSLVSSHQYFSWLSSALGLSLIAAGYYRKENIYSVGNALIALSFTLLITIPYLSQSFVDKLTELISTVAVLSILFLCIVQFNAFGIIGAALFAVAGLAFGADGELFGVLRVNLFHYALFLGVVGLSKGLTVKPPPVYYRPSS